MRTTATSLTTETRTDDLRPPHTQVRSRILWLIPLLLSVAFVGVMVFWLNKSDAEEREKQRQTMIADALSLEVQLRATLEAEAGNLQLLARSIRAGRLTPDNFAASTEVNAGLRRFWQSITWLDDQNRLLAHVPPETERPQVTPRGIEDERGISSHFSAALTDDQGKPRGSLVVRYAPASMLKRNVPWWLARKYDVRLVDGNDLEIAATGDALNRVVPGDPLDSYRVNFEPTIKDAFLELTQRQRVLPWHQLLPVTLMLGFLALIAASTWILWRQMRDVARAETAWRTEAAWRSAIEDSSMVGLRARDLDGRLVYVNRTFTDLVGFPADQLLGLMPPMPYWLPDDTGEAMQRHRRNMEGRAPREGYEVRWRHRDGHELIAMVYETPLIDAKGVHVGWMGSVLDVTARRQMEAREQRQITTLQHNARLTMLGEIASTLAHELNQPLTAIVSYNTGVMNSLANANFTDPVVLGALQRLSEQAKNAGRIVQRIRAFLTRHTPQLEASEIEPIVKAAADLFKRDFERQRITLAIHAAASLPRLEIDVVLVEQVLINLMRNAMDAFGEQPEGTPRKIDVTLQAVSANWMRINIADNGPGPAGRTLEQLCAPFYSTKAEGMGMGLAICRSIIEAHGGALEVTDTFPARAGIPASGATFSFSLPVSIASERTIAVTDDAGAIA